MAILQGEAQKEDFVLIADDPTGTTAITLAQVQQPGICCFGMPALAETSFTSSFNNDQHDVMTFWNLAYTGAVMTFQTFTNGAWVDVTTIVDNSLGTFNAFGFNNIVPEQNIFQENAIELLIDWALVLAAHGAGRYRVKTTGTTFDANTLDIISLDFCLEEFSEARADKTVRIEWFLNQNIGDEDDDTKKKDYGTLNIFNQLRLPNAMFGGDKSDYDREFTKYQTGRMTQTKNEQVEAYTLTTGQMPNEIHRLIKINCLQSPDIFVTDYNLLNATPHTQQSVIMASGYEPTYVKGVRKYKVEIEFEQAFQNFVTKNC